jgi:hypothetical protein
MGWSGDGSGMLLTNSRHFEKKEQARLYVFLKSGSCVSVGEEGADVLLGARKQETDLLKINDSVTRPGYKFVA